MYTDTRRLTYKSQPPLDPASSSQRREAPLCLTCREPTRGSSPAIRCGRFIGAIPRGISPPDDSDDGRWNRARYLHAHRRHTVVDVCAIRLTIFSISHKGKLGYPYLSSRSTSTVDSTGIDGRLRNEIPILRVAKINLLRDSSSFSRSVSRWTARDRRLHESFGNTTFAKRTLCSYPNTGNVSYQGWSERCTE